jgi:hypothetical protein
LRGFSELYGLWKMYCTWRRVSRSRARAAGGSGVPFRAISPVKLRCSPATQRASVVLPLPDSPTSATHSRGRTATLTPCSTSRCA